MCWRTRATRITWTTVRSPLFGIRMVLIEDRSSRKFANATDPYEPWPHHEFLLFPPPMRMLATRPQRKTAPMPGAAPGPQPIRAAEDDFICTFCELDLFFGTEKARKRAIRRLKAERKRKENIRNKAKDVADGKGTLKDDESDFDDDYSCGEDDGTGRCTCVTTCLYCARS